MTEQEKQDILNRIQKLESNHNSLNLKDEELRKKIDDVDFKAFGRDGLKNLKKTWIEFVTPNLGSGVQNDLGVVLEDSADDTAQFNFMVPRDLSPIFYELVWSGQFPGNAGDIYVKATVGAGQKGETGLARTSTGSYMTLTSLADYKLNYTDLKDFGIDLTVIKKDDYVNIEIERDATDVSDTLDTGCIIHGLKITYI